MSVEGRFEPLAWGRGRSMSSTAREWLHPVESGHLNWRSARDPTTVGKPDPRLRLSAKAGAVERQWARGLHLGVWQAVRQDIDNLLLKCEPRHTFQPIPWLLY